MELSKLKGNIMEWEIYIVFLLFIGITSDSPILTYLPFIVLTIFWVLNLIAFGSLDIRQYSLFAFVAPLTFFLVWVYGVLLGIANENNPAFIFRNFAGMAMYCMYFIISSFKLSSERIIKIIINCCLLILLLNLLDLKSVAEKIAVSALSQRILYSFNLVFLFTLFPILLGALFFNIRQTSFILKNRFVVFVLIVLVALFSILLMQSKGIYLAFAFDVFVILLARFINNYKLSVLRKAAIFFPIICLVIIGFVVLNNSEVVIFGSKDESNATRITQLELIMKELTLFGKGLGAAFTEPELIRDAEYPYALEITYVNLIHKIGILSVFLFLIYLYPVVYAFCLLLKKKRDYIFRGLVILGLSTYLFTSIGNPMLFSPFAVFCHCITFVLMNTIKYEERNYQ